MTKVEFVKELKKQLKGLSETEINERINFYTEIIDDKIEEGMTEEEAVAGLGSIDDVVIEIAGETNLYKIIKNKMKPKRKLSALEVVLLILGFPLWFPLLVTALVLCLVGYILIWTLVIVMYSIELAFIVCFVAGIAAFVMSLLKGNFYLTYLGTIIASLGLMILFFYVSKVVTVLTFRFTKKIVLNIKKSIMTRGNNND